MPSSALWWWAAGRRSDPGSRYTGTIPFNSLPDMYLVLMNRTGDPVTKAPVSLSSRPPHKIGVQPGETAGGHTVYVLPEDTAITAVRWSARPEIDLNTLVWTIDD